MSSVFKKIIDKEIPAEIVFETESVLCFKDIHPKASLHLLIIPKKEIVDLQSVQKEDLFLIGEIIEVAQKMAKAFNVEEGYRLVVNNGPLSGQEVPHLHFHLLGGKPL
jgi:histidine triad (HIT) family protein